MTMLRPLHTPSHLQSHPGLSQSPHLVAVQDFYSMWRSRVVTDPWGSTTPATETLLLHYEDTRVSTCDMYDSSVMHICAYMCISFLGIWCLLPLKVFGL